MFMSSATLDRVLDAASAGGADFAEVFCEDNRQTVLGVRAAGIESSTLGRESGVGIRIFSGLNCYYAYSNDTREETLLKLTRELSSVVKSGAQQRIPLGAMIDRSHPISPMPMSTVDAKRKLGLINAVVRAGMEYHEDISQMHVKYLDHDRRILVANTEGLLATDRQLKTRMLISAYAQRGSELRSGYFGPGAMAGMEFYDNLDLEAVGRRAADAAVTELRAKKCPSGMMTVVVDNGFGGLMFHEACGHSLEASSVAKGMSEFSGKLGKLVASSCLTLIDDGSIPGLWGSLGMDDEGNPTQRNVLIENGILKGYLIDKLESRRMGMAATGSGRRQNYRFAPEARMSNTFIAPGTSTRDEIISSVEKGLFVGNINGGSVNPVTGDFNFSVAQCWLIENGRLTEPVYGATLIGNGGNVLQQVDMVGDNLVHGQGYCYNNSGALFINAGQPTIRVKNILVGGLA